jgi:hypothetical protein
MRNGSGWQSFAEWALAGALLSFAAIGAASIGMFVFPLAVLALVLAVRRNSAWPEAPAGALTGVGSVCLFVAYVNRAYSPCPEMPIRFRAEIGYHGPFSCGGFKPMPWLIAGLLLIAAGLVGFLVRRRTRLAATAT